VHTLVVVAVRIGDEPASAAQFRLDPLARLAKLTAELGVGQLCEVGMREGVRADLDLVGDQIAKLIPVHGRELVRMSAGFRGELRNREWATFIGEFRTGEDGCGDAQPLQRWYRGCDAHARRVTARWCGHESETAW